MNIQEAKNKALYIQQYLNGDLAIVKHIAKLWRE